MSEETAAEERIATALIELLRKDSLDRISITDITTVAGVSRVSYYRHFSSKEDILLKHTCYVLDSLIEEIRAGGLRSGASFWQRFTKVMGESELVISMERAGLLDEFFSLFDERMRIIFSIVMGLDMDDKINFVMLKFISGGLIRLLRSSVVDDKEINENDITSFLRLLGEKVLL